MGGCVHGELRGNRTPAAEANFVSDPEAANAVFTSFAGKIVLADLGITHQTDMDVLRKRCWEQHLACGENGEEDASKIAKLVYGVSQAFIDCHLEIFKQPNAPAHDLVTMMYVTRPDLFVTRAARVEIELDGRWTRGMSVVDWSGKWKKP